jgi:hypothetical protein
MTPRKKHVIIIDQPTASARDAVHSIVKENAVGWWHHFNDAWIVTGHTPSYWRDKVKAVLNEPSSSVLVLALPHEEADRYWSLYGANASTKGRWLHENYRS